MIFWLKKLLHYVLKTFWIIGMFVFLYILAHIVLATLPAQWSRPKVTGKIDIFVKTDGFHTEIILPTHTTQKDWSKTITFGKDASYIAFGWGDRGFYLGTPTTSDFQINIAFKALFYLGTSVMHLTYHKELTENEQCRKLYLSETDYQKLVNFIEKSFLHDSVGKPKLIREHQYGKHHLFFEAKGSYSLFYTCNTWIVEALKSGEQPTCWWTPFASGIFYHL